jgi:hypothetical protein
VRKLEVNGEARSTTQVFNLEGETSTNPVPMGRGEYKTRTSWEKNKLVTLGTQTVTNRNGQRDLPIKEEFSLSKDGKELTLKTTRTTARGKATSKMVYRKQ